MKEKYTLTELVQLAEKTNDISLLRLIREEINKRIEQLCVTYGQQLEKPKKVIKKKIGFNIDQG